jgi:hypothetical protein
MGRLYNDGPHRILAHANIFAICGHRPAQIFSQMLLADNAGCDVRKWWRIGLPAKQIGSIEAEARALCENANGPAARKAILDRSKKLRKEHWHASMRLSRLAACIADQTKERTGGDVEPGRE